MKTRVKVNYNDSPYELTLDEAEIYCSLKMGADKDAQEFQRKIACELANIFDVGREDVISNEDKARYYLAISTRGGAIQNDLFSAKNAIELLNWWNAVRLAMVRGNRLIFNITEKVLLPTLFSIGGLAYLKGLVIDIYGIFKSAFNPRSQLERDLGFWQRFKNAAKEGDRPSRMSNDLLWFGVNFTCFILSLGLTGLASATATLISSSLNLAGFSVDVGHDSGFAFLNYKKCRNALNNVNNRINTLQRELDGLDKNSFQSLVLNKQKELDQLKGTIRPQLQEKVKTTWEATRRTMIVTVGLVVGMWLVFFPPTMIVGAVLIGSAMAFGFGSVYGGLGRRLRLLASQGVDYLRNKLSKPKETDAALKVELPLQEKLSLVKQSSLESVTALDSPTSVSRATTTASTASTLRTLSSPSAALTPDIELTPPGSTTGSPSFIRANSADSASPTHETYNLFEKSTKMMHSSIKKLIEFVDKLNQIPPTDKAQSITYILNCYSISEIRKIRELLGFSDDMSWNKQLGYWLQYYTNPNQQEHLEPQRRGYYQCSFKDALIQRIIEERRLAALADCRPDALPAISHDEEHYRAKLAEHAHNRMPLLHDVGLV